MTSRTQKITFPGAGGEKLAGRLEMPASSPRAYVLFAHCFTCTKDIFAARRIAAGLTDRGFAVLRFDFTGLGHSEGEFANTDFSSNVGDLVAAADYLRENYEAPRILVGHSLGGAAILAAADSIPESVAVATINAPSDPGHIMNSLKIDPEEIENLREYLLRGGFLLIDDFWGTQQWNNFFAAFSQVFPDREIIQLPPDHEIYHVYYDIDGAQMIPALGRSDQYGEQDVDYATNHAIVDDDGRVMVLINWNSDMGDGWEHTYHPAYPTRYANAAYQLGINYLMYSLTH